MSTSGNTEGIIGLAAGVKKTLASSLISLGRFHNGEYVLSRHCLESVKDLIRLLRRDNESYDVRRHLGEAKVVQNDLIRIIKVCPAEMGDLFDLTIRLLTTLTSPVFVLYSEELPAEKVGRMICMNLIAQLQEYKEAFYDIDFWNVICGKLTDLFEINWVERSESQCLEIEKMLVLIRNVLHVPANPDREKITENDVSIHDKILWSLRQSQILEFLLYVSSNKEEQRYYLHLLEIFSLILREQNPKLLALSQLESSQQEREKKIQDLIALREREKVNMKKYKNARTFESTVAFKDLKYFSGKYVLHHGTLDSMKEPILNMDKKKGKRRKNKIPVQSEQIERRSSFSVRIFLKEFCIEFLNCSYNNMMSVVKEKLRAGKGLPNDEAFYFWALKFFLEFNFTYNSDIKLITDSVNLQTFHFLQTNMDENFEKLISEKKRKALWVRKLHLILKAYHSLLQTLKWMESLRDAGSRDMSAVLKSQLFYMPEYRDMALVFFTRYDPNLFPLPYLKDVIETAHLSMKILEEYTKSNKIVVRKKFRKTKRVQKAPPSPLYESYAEKWDRLKGKIYEHLNNDVEFPDIAPFDVLSELNDEEQEKNAMRNIQKLLHEEKIKDGIGLLRSARRVWPENDHFGKNGISVEDEVGILHEICLAELGNEQVPIKALVDQEAEGKNAEEEDEEETDDDSGDCEVSEEIFDMRNYKMQLVNKRVVEACSIMLQNYVENSAYTNHCIIKILFRVGWECRMPAMMYQASLFSTLLKIMKENCGNFKELKDFAVHLFRKFQEHALKNKFAFAELLFWKDSTAALEIQDEIDKTSESGATNVNRKGRKACSWSIEEEDELQRLWNECSPEFPVKKKIEWIKSHLIDESKSLQGVKKKLMELGLIANTRQIAKFNSRKEWMAEEIEELTKFFHTFQHASDIVLIIYDHLTIKRTKQSIRQKLVELGLVSSISQLRKKKNKCVPESTDVNEESELSEESDNEPTHMYSLEEQKEALKRSSHLKPALEWLRDTIQESLEEDDEETQAYPLLAVEQVQVDALETEVFINLLQTFGLEEPVAGQVYWKIPKRNKLGLTQLVNLLNDAINEDLRAYDSSESEDEFEKLKRLTRKVPRAGESRPSVERENQVIDSDYYVDEIIKNPATRESPKLSSDSYNDEMKFRTMNKSRSSSNGRQSNIKLLNYETQPSEAEKDAIESADSLEINDPNELADGKLLTADEFVSGDSPIQGSRRNNRKKRRYIASDSEEEEDSGDSKGVSEKVNKRIRVLDSDSDLESNNVD